MSIIHSTVERPGLAYYSFLLGQGSDSLNSLSVKFPKCGRIFLQGVIHGILMGGTTEILSTSEGEAPSPPGNVAFKTAKKKKKNLAAGNHDSITTTTDWSARTGDATTTSSTLGLSGSCPTRASNSSPSMLSRDYSPPAGPLSSRLPMTLPIHSKQQQGRSPIGHGYRRTKKSTA